MFLYVFGLMFLVIFGAAMLFYPLLSAIMNAENKDRSIETKKTK